MPEDQPKLGVDQTVKFFEELAVLILAACDAKKKGGWMDVISLLPKIQLVLETGKNALPELESVSKEDAVKITEAAYDAFKKITDAS